MHYTNSMTLHGVLPLPSWPPPSQRRCPAGCIADPNIAQKEQEWQKARENALQRAIQDFSRQSGRGFLRRTAPEEQMKLATRLADQANNMLRYNRIPMARMAGFLRDTKIGIGVRPINAVEIMRGQAAAPTVQQAVETQPVAQQPAPAPKPKPKRKPKPKPQPFVRRARSRRGSFIRGGTVFGVNSFYGQQYLS